MNADVSPAPTGLTSSLTNMRSLRVRAKALELSDRGLSDGEVGRRLELPHSTVQYMRRSKDRGGWRCPRCWRAGKRVEPCLADYAELLGLYLGDGCISKAGRTERLRLALDMRYSVILHESRELLKRSFPASSIGTVTADAGATAMLSVYSSHLSCLFPQNGPGKKHEREIALEEWQADVVASESWAFLRGCIRSDGCAFINRAGPYEYLTYEFRNRSAEILGLFAGACDEAGLDYRLTFERVRVNRRASVERLKRNVGLKA